MSLQRAVASKPVLFIAQAGLRRGPRFFLIASGRDFLVFRRAETNDAMYTSPANGGDVGDVRYTFHTSCVIAS